MFQRSNSNRSNDGTSRPHGGVAGRRGGNQTLRLGLAVLAGLCWILALEWLFGSVLSLAANR